MAPMPDAQWIGANITRFAWPLAKVIRLLTRFSFMNTMFWGRDRLVPDICRHFHNHIPLAATRYVNGVSLKEL